MKSSKEGFIEQLCSEVYLENWTLYYKSKSKATEKVLYTSLVKGTVFFSLIFKYCGNNIWKDKGKTITISNLISLIACIIRKKRKQKRETA